MKAAELNGNANQLATKIKNSKNTKFFIESPISFRRIRISKIEASNSVFHSLHTEIKFVDYGNGEGILMTRKERV